MTDRAARADGTRRTPTWTRPAAGLVLATLVLLGTASCTTEPPAPDAAAAALAQGIAQGDLADVPLADGATAEATAQLTAAYEALAPMRPAVEVTSVELDGPADDEATRTATAELAFTWDVDAGETDWTYTTTADLELVENDEEEAWVARWSPFLLAPDLRASETLSTERVPAERGDVLGAGGSAVLVEPRPVLRLGLDKTRLDAAGHEAAARRIAEVLGLDPEGYATRVAGAGERAFVEALVVRTEEPGVDLAAFRSVDGALAVDDVLPLAPTRTFARAVLGTAGPATAEIIDESEGRVAAGDLAGLSGLQHQYDEQLRGRPGLTIVATASDTEARRELFHVDPVPGEPLVTTLVPEVQAAAETVLADVGPASALVAVRPSTGELLAVASGPGSDGYSTATLGTFAPGSVFKVVSSLALLREGRTPQSTLECPDTTTVDGRAFSNFPGYPEQALGTISLATAVAHSCNTAFIGARDEATPQALAAAAGSLGVGVPADLGFPAFLGTVPTDATGTDHAASVIGQGRIQASPLAMATMAASVGHGQTVTPWLVGAEPPAAPADVEPLTAEEADDLRRMMRGVVTDGGATLLRDVPGPEVAAKTGTAQTGSGEELHNHAWMVALQGDLAVAVFVEEGEYGSTTAGPLMAWFLSLVAP